MKPEIRIIKSEDKAFKGLCALRREVFCDELGEKTSFAKDERDKDAFHCVYTLDNVVVGCASAVFNDDGEYEIYKLAVRKHYRNFRVGTVILNELKNVGKKEGASVIVAYGKPDSVKFFTKNNFPYDGIVYLNDEKYLKYVDNLIFEDAQWVDFNGETQAVIAKTEFTVTKKSPAYLYVTGLGYCHIYINGKKISDRELAPAWTSYRKLATEELNYPIYDTMTYRIMYEKIDVSPFLKKGKNTIVFHIGSGWYSQRECPNEGVMPYGNLELCYKLQCDGQVVSSSSKDLKYRKSFITRANVYYGEDHDSRLGGYDFSKYDDCTKDWSNATPIQKPCAVLVEQKCPADRTVKIHKPVCIFKRGDYAVYDIGENIAGYPVVKFADCAYTGERCTLRYAEVLDSEGGLDFHTTGGEFRMQKDTFIYDNQCKEFHPHFTWHGARYFDVLGRIEVIEYREVHTDIKPVVEFKSSDETLQWIYDAYVRTQLNNIHGCIPSDCPHRERLGYTGDGQLTVNAVMTCFDAEGMYRKWMQDIADCQDIYNGHVQHTAPFYGGGGGPGGWGGAMVIVPYAFYKHYGDVSVLEKYYPNMVEYLNYMEEHSENGIVVREELLGWCLGDWCSPDNRNLIPPEFVNTYFYIKTLGMAIEVAGILGKNCKVLKDRYKASVKAFTDKYYDKKTGTFCGSAEASDAYGYDLGLGNEKTLAAIVAKYEKLGEFDTGIFGTDILIRTLCENSHKDLALKLLTSKKDNTFYNMKKHGATTLWENWDGAHSHSHPMFGAIVEYIVKYFNEA